MKNTMKKLTALLLALTMVFALAACGGGSKDALAGKWSADLGLDGTVTWTFDGKGKVEFTNFGGTQKGTYSITGDQLTVKLELWDAEKTYTFSVDGSSLTMTDNAGTGVDGTFAKQ